MSPRKEPHPLFRRDIPRAVRTHTERLIPCIKLSHDLVVRCLRGYRLPEPLRVAHLMANKHKRYMEKGDKKNRQDSEDTTE